MTRNTSEDGDSIEEKQISKQLSEMLEEQQAPVQEEYQAFYEWMLERGKDHLMYEGLADSTADKYFRRLDQLHREAISLLETSDVTTITPDQGEELLLLLAKNTITKRTDEAFSKSSKRKFSNTLEKYFEWQYHTDRLEYEWKSRIRFSDGNHTSAAEFSYEEMGRLFEVAESYKKLPSYYETSPEERDRINGLVAQRLSKPKENVNRDDWRKADHSSKIWSLVSVGYDAGLTPIEIQRAKVSWYKPDQQMLVIPTDAASKQREKEKVSLSDDSCEALSRWIRERRHLEKYDGTNSLWLNQVGNPYRSSSLCNLIRRLCEEAGITSENRPIRWYSLRHSVGRQMKSDGSLVQTNDQLRHDTLETTQTTYGNSAVEERCETLNKSRSKAKRAANDPDYEPYSGVDLQTEFGKVEETGPEDAITPRDDGSIHINAIIENTTENRVRVSRQLLSDEESSSSS
ncbi:tyrosine-type recombinase/integrase [Halobellus salinisoli]|uniref:tyrosine-type recombinase/integrase n=1 Tax=Halobellus salinisoli TaxID=3108500 RepID=UPI00300B0140